MTEDVKTIACVLFPGIDPLDLIGPMQALNMLAFLRPGWRAVVVGERIEAYETEAPLRFTPSHTFDEVPSPDVLVVPGASTPAFRAMTDERLLTTSAMRRPTPRSSPPCAPARCYSAPPAC